MRGHSLIRSASAALLLAATFLAGRGTASAQVAKLDDQQIAGVWHEISHIPDKRERDCGRDSTLLIARGDKPNQLMLQGTCKLKNGQQSTWNFSAAPAKHHDDGRLRIPFLWLLHHSYWVYALDADAGWCVIGTPNHKQLWVYAQQPTLSPEAATQAQSAASAAGFNTAKLVPASQGATASATLNGPPR